MGVAEVVLGEDLAAYTDCTRYRRSYAGLPEWLQEVWETIDPRAQRTCFVAQDSQARPTAAAKPVHELPA